MNSKPFYQSKTIIGLAITTLPYILKYIDKLAGTNLADPNVDILCQTIGVMLGVKGRIDIAPLKIK